jgi:hypothetical protein
LSAGPARDDALQEILSRWSSTDPERAASMAVALPAGAVRDQAIVDIGQQWAKKDARAALGWAETLVEGQDAARQSVLAAWVQNEPAAATAYVAALAPS